MLPEPQALLTEAPILLGIDNRKMSKSYGNAIELGADPDTIRSMVGRMITDPLKQRRGDPGRPEICNVFSYEKLFGTPAERVAEIDRTCRSGELGCREHKDEIAERIVEYLRPFRERREAALADRGSWSACSTAAPTVRESWPCRTCRPRRKRWGCERSSLSPSTWTSSRGRSTSSSR